MTPARVSRAEYERLAKARPREPKRPRKPPRREEAALLKQCLEWLKLKGIMAWRANSGGGMRRGRGGRMVPVVGNPAGTPDVLAVLPVRLVCDSPGGETWRTVGALVGIEAKAPGGRLRPSQRAWKENAERNGVLYLQVRCLQDLIDALREEGVAP